MRRFSMILFCVAALSTAAFAQDDHNDAGPTSIGYAVVTATGGVSPTGISGGLTVFETLGFRSQVPALQASVLPATLTTQMDLFASASIRASRNVGVGITNPGTTSATVAMTLRATNGSLTASTSITVGPLRETAQFVSDLFANVPDMPPDFDGTLTITSNIPVGIMALMFNGTAFSAIPVASLSPTVVLPVMTAGVGGSNSVLLPEFVADGGWASEIVVLNNGAAPLTVRMDLFKQDGTPLVTKLNHQSGSSFVNLVIAPGGIIIYAPLNANGVSDF
jgi:hypothetical protein